MGILKAGLDFRFVLFLMFSLTLHFQDAEAAINCGPGSITYGLYANATSTQPVGFRCIRFVDKNSFVWYGETNSARSNKRIRELGYGLKNGGGIFETKAEIIYGNGEESVYPYTSNTIVGYNFYLEPED